MLPVKISNDLNRLALLIRRGQVTQKQVEIATGVDQSQISRILAGKVKRVSTNVKYLCKYANSLEAPEKDEQEYKKILINAALDLWDGSESSAITLQELFLSIKDIQAGRRIR